MHGMAMERVAAALGHADTGITCKTYLHFFPDRWEADMARFSAGLAAPNARVIPLQREAQNSGLVSLRANSNPTHQRSSQDLGLCAISPVHIAMIAIPITLALAKCSGVVIRVLR